MNDTKAFWLIAAALALGGLYYIFIGIPAYEECREQFSMRVCLRLLVR